ncbi:hypothetical protein ACFOOM_01030 [Streptomyces echinoruber]|uniref:Uncharacterized protein n=1 Tax=Streptomyces echinoruber TaxID=68898 RepID=A0A918QV04_9ACTN|nr:hypothetical protein [Streptomyces echinoruber]GGZ73142.1 hypothetical protein GCM10010389_08280 [Streptomyces echinoruber]
MKVTEVIEEIELIVEVGEAADALDLSRRLAGEHHTNWAIGVRRTVARGELDRNALRAVADRIAEATRPAPVDWSLVVELRAVEAGLRAALAADAATPSAERRERSKRQWAEQQRHEERVRAYNAEVERVNRERGRARNRAQAAAVFAKTCPTCFQVPAASGECGC